MEHLIEANTIDLQKSYAMGGEISTPEILQVFHMWDSGIFPLVRSTLLERLKSRTESQKHRSVNVSRVGLLP